MLLEVYVQQPNKPPGHYVGMVSEFAEGHEVAKQVGVPDGCLVDAKIVKRKGKRRWSVVALVGFREAKNV